MISLILVISFVLLLVFINKWTLFVDDWVCEGCNNCDEPLSSSLFDIPPNLTSTFDKYGRLLGEMYINKEDTVSVNQQMIDNKYGYEYHGGTKKV